jgi:hypothetical protein
LTVSIPCFVSAPLPLFCFATIIFYFKLVFEVKNIRFESNPHR